MYPARSMPNGTRALLRSAASEGADEAAAAGSPDLCGPETRPWQWPGQCGGAQDQAGELPLHGNCSITCASAGFDAGQRPRVCGAPRGRAELRSPAPLIAVPAGQRRWPHEVHRAASPLSAFRSGRPARCTLRPASSCSMPRCASSTPTCRRRICSRISLNQARGRPIRRTVHRCPPPHRGSCAARSTHAENLRRARAARSRRWHAPRGAAAVMVDHHRHAAGGPGHRPAPAARAHRRARSASESHATRPALAPRRQPPDGPAARARDQEPARRPARRRAAAGARAPRPGAARIHPRHHQRGRPAHALLDSMLGSGAPAARSSW